MEKIREIEDGQLTMEMPLPLTAVLMGMGEHVVIVKASTIPIGPSRFGTKLMLFRY
ncbi:MAG: hypothetical protein HQL09_10570 [Nitrospirae bacterium]|nr:hypothetical protein [Nitrospirota bacterium]